MRVRSVLSVAALVAAFGAAGLAQKNATVGTFPTWDADMINIENVSETGAGVYVAVLDTGLVPNWRDYFDDDRVATNLGTGFEQSIAFNVANIDPCGYGIAVGPLKQTTWVGSTGSTHGTHVASTILGYDYRSNADLAGGFPLPPITVRGIAPDVTIIPVKVLSDYQVPALPRCTDPGPLPSVKITVGTDSMVVAGIDYVTDLALAGYRPMVINMSLGGSDLGPTEKAALDRAIANGVIVVAAAGNEGEDGMSFPGAYAPVISAGAAGWTKEWLKPTDGLPRYRMWWLKYPYAPLLPGSGDVADPTSVNDVYVTDFSSRELEGQELDVLAPGSWVRGPFPGSPGFSHLPWWSRGIGDIVGGNPGNFFYVGGTSMATPHVSSLAAMMLEKNATLTQATVESTMKSTALAIPAVGSRAIFDFDRPAVISWDTDCGDLGPCDAVGSGLILADAALAATP
jgi:subtilisin family serine protease